MNDYLKIVEEKIKNNIKIEEIKIINNSAKHKKHRFYDSRRYHLGLEIKSNFLKSLNKVKAQRIIMNVLQDDLKDKIHALEISIK